jgi:hypothetical protein
MTSPQIMFNRGDIFVHRLRCAYGHTFRIRAERRPSMTFSQFGVRCPKCNVDVYDGAAGHVDTSHVRQVFRLPLRWTGDPGDGRRRLGLQSAVDDAAEAADYFGEASVHEANGEVVVVGASIYLEDADAFAGQRWLPEDEARSFVENALAAGARAKR